MKAQLSSWCPVLMVVVALAFLAGCGASDEDELRQWMAEQRNQVKSQVTPLAEPKKFIPEAYTQDAALDPFDAVRLTRALRRDSAQNATNAGLIAPEMARRKEPLEAFPLDSMAMVGSLDKKGAPTALVSVDKLLYQVRVGNYLGQNYGLIMKITETEIILREIVQDASGEWVERPTTLVLQERKK